VPGVEEVGEPEIMARQPAVTLTRSHCDGEITTTDAVLSF
jgi:hypothetical protein